jgi:hypothetical protein
MDYGGITGSSPEPAQDRQSITETVFTVSNLHDTLRYCEMLAGERRPSQMPAISTTA